MINDKKILSKFVKSANYVRKATLGEIKPQKRLRGIIDKLPKYLDLNIAQKRKFKQIENKSNTYFNKLFDCTVEIAENFNNFKNISFQLIERAVKNNKKDYTSIIKDVINGKLVPKHSTFCKIPGCKGSPKKGGGSFVRGFCWNHYKQYLHGKIAASGAGKDTILWSAESNYGECDDVKAFLKRNKIGYIHHSNAKYEYSAKLLDTWNEKRNRHILCTR